jgi:tetraacyldisaccharide 4'-kinase
MRPPEFWNADPAHPGVLARVLGPAAALTAHATARRVARAPKMQPDIPVICVGNLNIGGTGKTPAVIALGARLSAAGHGVHVVTRGHGGSEAGPLQVDPLRHSAALVGDEALLHAAFAPTWVARDRAAGVQAAQDAGAGVVLMDDGHQNPDVAKSLSLIVVDAARGFGNGRVFPAGPLREPVAVGLARADLLLSMGDAGAQSKFSNLWASAISVPLLTGQLNPLATGMDWTDLRVFAFAGIGDPPRFFATLDALGASRVESIALDDHQPLSGALFTRLEGQAKALGAQLVCTEKDAVRLSVAERARVLTVPVRLAVDDWAQLDAALARLGL